jgi:hypothetical protein
MCRRFGGTWRNRSHQVTLVDLDLVQSAGFGGSGVGVLEKERDEVEAVEGEGGEGFAREAGVERETGIARGCWQFREFEMGGVEIEPSTRGAVEGGRFACACSGIVSNGCTAWSCRVGSGRGLTCTGAD